MKKKLISLNILFSILKQVVLIEWNYDSPNKLYWAFDCDFDGNDMTNVRMNGETCGPTCSRTTGCTHFAWSKYQGGTCWMKKGSISKTNAKTIQGSDLVCGIIDAGVLIEWNFDSPNKLYWAFDCDFEGNDLTNTQTNGKSCGPTCLRTNGCTHFTWSDYQGGTCWMKKGSISKTNAKIIQGRGFVCGILTIPNSNQIEFITINNCPYTVWVGMQGRVYSNSNWMLPNNGGWELKSGQTKSVSVPKDFYAGRLWGRTNCYYNNGQFKCETGDCGPWIECANGGVQRGGQTPATLAEFTLNGAGNQDYYDVSLVDGYNLKMTIEVTNPSASGNGQYWCKNPACLKDLNSICPQELKKFNSNGQVIGCLSACEKFRTDQYCCRGAFGTPQTCKSSNWPVNYPSVFKQACPSAYSYAYDDSTSTFFCRNTNYRIIFC